jgi:hypothetical protein
MVQRNKQERKDLMTRAGASGSSSRTGPDDPRHRRGAQAEMDLEQRFDPDDFDVDDKQRVRAKKIVVPAQAAVIPGGGVTTLSGTNDAYVVLALGAAATRVGDYITVDTAGDHFTLRGGSVYLVTADVVYRNSDTNTYLTTTTKLSSASGTVYDSRVVSVPDTVSGMQDRISVRVGAVVDLSLSGPEDLDLQVAGNDSDGTVNGTAGSLRIIIQRIG